MVLSSLASPRGDDPLLHRPAEVIHPGCGSQPIEGWIQRPRPFASGHPGTGPSAPRRRLLPAGSASRFPLGHPPRQSAATTAKAFDPAAPPLRDGCPSRGEAEPLPPERDRLRPRSPPLDSTCFRRCHLPEVWRRTRVGWYNSLGIRAPHAFPVHSTWAGWPSFAISGRESETSKDPVRHPWEGSCARRRTSFIQ